MPRFFYSASNLQNHHAPESWWRRWRRKKERKKALQQLDANLVQVKNPFRKETPAPKNFSKQGITFLILIFLVWLNTMIFLPYFRVTKMQIQGLNIIKESEIRDFVNNNFLIPKYNWWPRNNYFILNKDTVAEQLKKNFAIESITVKKVFPNQVDLVITEKTTSVIYDNGREYILLDEEGRFVKILKPINENEFYTEAMVTNTDNNTSSTSSTVVTMNVQENIQPSTTIKIHQPNFLEIKKEMGSFPIVYDHRIGCEEKNSLEKEVVVAALTWKKMLEQGKVGELHYFVLENLAAGLNIKTSNPWNILININGNHENAYNNLEAVVRNSKPTEYIDLRYGERVYWK